MRVWGEFWAAGGVGGEAMSLTPEELEQARAASPDILTLPEAAKLLRCSTKTVVKRAREGKIPGMQLAGPNSPWRFSRTAILEVLNGHRAA